MFGLNLGHYPIGICFGGDRLVPTENTMKTSLAQKQVFFWMLALILAGGCASQDELSSARTSYRQPLRVAGRAIRRPASGSAEHHSHAGRLGANR